MKEINNRDIQSLLPSELADLIGEELMICFSDGIWVRKLIGITSKKNYIFDDWTEITYNQIMDPNNLWPVRIYLKSKILALLTEN